MPLSSEINQNQLIVAAACGGVAAFFHWASVQTSDKVVPPRVLQGQMIASFASGIITTWVLGMQTMFKVDALGAFCVAAVVGFAYGPTALVVAARRAARQFNLDMPDLPGGPTVQGAVTVLTDRARDTLPTLPEVTEVASDPLPPLPALPTEEMP